MHALQVEGRAPLLVHHADLEGGLRQAEHVFDPAEQLGGERDLVGTVHLRLDDVDGPGAAVDQRAVGVTLLESVDRRRAGEERVHDAFEHLVALGVHDRVVGHQVTHVADEQQRASGQHELAAVRGGVVAVLVEHPGERAAVLVHLGGQVAPVQAQPIAVGADFVVGVDGRHRVLEVDDGGHR